MAKTTMATANGAQAEGSGDLFTNTLVWEIKETLLSEQNHLLSCFNWTLLLLINWFVRKRGT